MSVTADLVSGILPVRDDGRVLLLQRPTGTWDPPAGRLATGESFKRGAVREVYEETGLLVAPQRILATWVGTGPNGDALAAVTYMGRTRGSAVRLSHEHLDYRWASVEEWLELPSWWSPENRRRVAPHLRRLPRDPSPEPPKPALQGDQAVVRAHLGAGTVLVDLDGPEPRALLLRRRKPPVGLWENPGGLLEAGEDFVSGARRELYEETGVTAEPTSAWWARVEPWRHPEDRELYAGVGFISRHPGGEVRIEDAAHGDYLWVIEAEWRKLPTWYAPRETETLWAAIRTLEEKDD